MKFWQKILVYSLIIFLTFLNIAGLILIQNSHNANLNREIERGLKEHLSIYSNVSIMIKNRAIYSKDFSSGILYSMLKKYLKSIDDEDSHIEILNSQNTILFTSFKNDIKNRPELENPPKTKRQYIIRDIDDTTYLFITNLIEIDGEEFKFSYIRNISHVYEDRKKQMEFFLKLDALISLLLAATMYMLSRLITRPINELTASTKKIASGDYSKRISAASKDEIGELSRNFNSMCDAIEEKIKELEKRDGERSRFIDSLTHEMKTPLTSIIGYSDFLRSTRYDESSFNKGINHIFNEGKRLEELSSKMMDLILLNHENLSQDETDLKKLLQEIKSSLSIRLDSKNIDMVINAKNLYILADESLLKNLFSNLIENSIKASDQNSTIYASVSTDSTGNTVVAIKDQGIGIAKDDLQKIFEPFYTADKSRSRKQNGAGLGLSICAQIAKLHNATLEAESEIGKGTTITAIFR